MRICVIGDVHGHLVGTDKLAVDFFVELVESLDVDFFLQAGDLNYYEKLPRTVYAIAGNRDFKHMVAHVRSASKNGGKLIFLRPGEVVSLDKDEETITVAGLSGGYDPVDYTDGPYPGDIRSYFTRADLEACLNIGSVDILMTHDAPKGLGFGPDGSWGEEPLTELAEKLDYKIMLCGHLHIYQAATIETKKIFSLDELAEEYYILDTEGWSLERIQSAP